jgi:hypothetical protein
MSRRGGQGSLPESFMWDLWWTSQHRCPPTKNGDFRCNYRVISAPYWFIYNRGDGQRVCWTWQF